jgi:hypothetical protein
MQPELPAEQPRESARRASSSYYAGSSRCRHRDAIAPVLPRGEPTVDLRFPRWNGVIRDDFDKQRAFYREVLGLRESEGNDDRSSTTSASTGRSCAWPGCSCYARTAGRRHEEKVGE